MDDLVRGLRRCNARHMSETAQVLAELRERLRQDIATHARSGADHPTMLAALNRHIDQLTDAADDVLSQVVALLAATKLQEILQVLRSDLADDPQGFFAE